jgi:hypothetical protein
MLLLLVAQAALHGALSEAPGLRGEDVVLLLEIGVGEQEIAAFAERVGGFEPLDGARYAAVEALAPSAEFLQRLPRTAAEFGPLSELARCSEVFQDDALGLAFIYPAGWVVSKTSTGNAGTILRVGPRFDGEPRVFVTPCIFLFLQKDTAIVRDAAAPLQGQVRQLLVRKLRAAGLRPGAGETRTVTLLGEPRETIAIDATVDGEAGGVLEVVLDVDGKGRAVGVGFTASAADRARIAQAFSRLAGSLVLR